MDQIKRLYKAIKRCTHEISLELLIKVLEFPDLNSIQKWLLDLDLDNIQINLNTQTLVIKEGLHTEIKQILDIKRKDVEQIKNIKENLQPLSDQASQV